MMMAPPPPAEYYVTINPDACSCPGWRYRHYCRHVRELRAASRVVESYKAKWEELKNGND